MAKATVEHATASTRSARGAKDTDILFFTYHTVSPLLQPSFIFTYLHLSHFYFLHIHSSPYASVNSGVPSHPISSPTGAPTLQVQCRSRLGTSSPQEPSPHLFPHLHPPLTLGSPSTPHLLFPKLPPLIHHSISSPDGSMRISLSHPPPVTSSRPPPTSPHFLTIYLLKSSASLSSLTLIPPTLTHTSNSHSLD